MIKLYTVLILLLIITGKLSAQTGELQGKITDAKNNEGIPFAPIVLQENGTQKAVGQTDDNGNFTIKPIEPGAYTLIVQYLGYQEVHLENIKITSDHISFQNVSLQPKTTELPTVIIVADKLIDPDHTSTGNTLDHTEIEHIATRNTNNYASLTAGVFQKDDGKKLNIVGARDNATQYYIDGMKVTGGGQNGQAINLPQTAIEQLTVITGGLPAKYGDALGGVINITTRGPSREYHGGVELVTSEFLDPYGYNLASLNISGPVYTKFKGTDSSRTKIGFFVSGEAEFNKDPSPSSVTLYKVKDDVLADLQLHPLTPSPSSTGFVPSAAFITAEDLETTKIRLNNQTTAYRLSGKLDFQLSNNLTLTIGGNTELDEFVNWDYNSSLFDFDDGNEVFHDNTFRGFVRFTQRFPTSLGKDKQSLFQNAYYSLQADYTKLLEKWDDPRLGFNAFEYGYVGKFTTYGEPLYLRGQDTIFDENGNIIRILEGWLYSGQIDTLVTFEPSDINPNLASYTSQYYDLAGGNPDGYYRSLNDIVNGGALLNGYLPVSTLSAYSIFWNTGYPVGTFGKRNNDQFHFAMNASVDIIKPGKGDKSKHALEFGFEFEQRIERRYLVAPLANGVGLWGLARQLANSHILALDLNNPIPVYDQFGVFLDTINYNRLFVDSDQTFFDESLRLALGLDPNGLDFIDVDAIDPSILSLSMFSPDELLNNGSNFYAAYGYDYLGNRLTSQPSLDDYFTQVDANGNLARNQAAYQPNYSSAYIQDKFNFRDLIFNIGLRVDRFDNNSPVLKDKYSLYPVRTVAEVSDLGPHPSNIGGDYYVYVNDIGQPTSIVGYRSGDTWFNAQGTEVADPKVIAQATSNGQIQPYLENNDLENLVLTSASFRDYKPELSFMPRIAFSFPISDQALFFAHYDVLTQRPNGNDARNVAFAPIFDYYFFNEFTNGGNILPNPNLKPEKTIDYQVGFKQALGTTSALTISGTYRELKDMIQVENVNYAYPHSYVSYGNSDFGTVKSIDLTYELRRIRNVKLDANYTLQFAAGTGSSATSGATLVGSGQPNLRTIVPFSYDQRHNITVSADYRFSEGKSYNGPTTGKNESQILANSGLNVIFRASSGTPYSQQTGATPTALFGVATQTSLDGSVNGSRLPWTFKVDAKIDKDFNIGKTKEKGGLYINVYLLVQNLFNTAGVLQVYRFTGNASDDGYIESAVGASTVENQVSPESFALLYNIKQNNPSYYFLARRIHLGAMLNF